jgi:hypothetical protein
MKINNLSIEVNSQSFKENVITEIMRIKGFQSKHFKKNQQVEKQLKRLEEKGL